MKFAQEEGIIGDVRRAREKHAAKFKLDLKAIIDGAKRRQHESGHKVVSFAKKK
jgi:hypothetical protein